MIININVAVRVAALALSSSRFFNYGTRGDSLIYIYILFFRQNFSFPFVLSYFLFLIIIIFRILERLNYSHAYNSAIPIYFQTSRKCHSRPWNFIGPIISRHARLPTLALRRFDTNSSPKKKRCFSPFRVKYRHIYTCIYIYRGANERFNSTHRVFFHDSSSRKVSSVLEEIDRPKYGSPYTFHLHPSSNDEGVASSSSYFSRN